MFSRNWLPHLRSIFKGRCAVLETCVHLEPMLSINFRKKNAINQFTECTEAVTVPVYPH
jgi:hypothetical protein